MTNFTGTIRGIAVIWLTDDANDMDMEVVRVGDFEARVDCHKHGTMLDAIQKMLMQLTDLECPLSHVFAGYDLLESVIEGNKVVLCENEIVGRLDEWFIEDVLRMILSHATVLA